MVLGKVLSARSNHKETKLLLLNLHSQKAICSVITISQEPRSITAPAGEASQPPNVSFASNFIQQGPPVTSVWCGIRRNCPCGCSRKNTG